jgi:hypothetical protein
MKDAELAWVVSRFPMLAWSVRRPAPDESNINTELGAVSMRPRSTYDVRNGDGRGDFGEGRQQPFVQAQPTFSGKGLLSYVPETGVHLRMSAGSRCL